MDKNIKFILDKLPYDISEYFSTDITEIRLRVHNNITLFTGRKKVVCADTQLSEKDITDTLMQFCDYTISAYEQQISKSFISLPGGHRIGIAGKYKNHNGDIVLIQATSLNIRINRNKLFDFDNEILNFNSGLLIAGRPHSGKTTMLRTICKRSSGNIVVCDERNEICPDFPDCDIISGIPKYLAIEYAIRSMAPDILICDEIGSQSEAEKILSCMNTGVKLICTVHSNSIQLLYKKPNISILLEAGIFDKIVLLSDEDFFVKEVVNV